MESHDWNYIWWLEHSFNIAMHMGTDGMWVNRNHTSKILDTKIICRLKNAFTDFERSSCCRRGTMTLSLKHSIAKQSICLSICMCVTVWKIITDISLQFAELPLLYSIKLEVKTVIKSSILNLNIIRISTLQFK